MGWILLLLCVFLVPAVIALSRGVELFVVKVDAGRVRFVRGKSPPALFAEIKDVLRRSDASGTLRVVSAEGQASLRFRGQFSAATRQQLRNVVGTFPLARIKNGVSLR